LSAIRLNPRDARKQLDRLKSAVRSKQAAGLLQYEPKAGAEVRPVIGAALPAPG
jgi:hypothetical protein